jgi:membrane protease YdiL (CAAX protease family)
MNSLPIDVLAFRAALSVITFAVFGRMLRRVQREGGKVRADIFGFPELLISFVLAQIFVGLVVIGVWRAAHGIAPKAIGIERVLPGALQFVILTVGLIGFLAFRGINVWRALGLGQVSLPRVVLLGFGLILAAFPGVVLGSTLMQLWLNSSAQKQELVILFEQVTKAADRAGIIQILVAGAIIAPVCEEFLFRGLFYPTFKRYLGSVPSALLTSALFAAFHLNLAALPGLFVLALCFVIAYEATGSLLVPMTMHALFNGGQLLALYLAVTKGIPT